MAFIGAYLVCGGAVLPQADAQAGKKPPDRGVLTFLEIGPRRDLKGGEAPAAAWGRRTTGADEKSFYTVRIDLGKQYHSFLADDLAEFVKRAKAIEAKRKGRKLPSGVQFQVVRWAIRDMGGKLVTFQGDPIKGTWALEMLGFDNLPEAIEQTLQDIETIKKTKPVLPW
jgi:hypothetical protein